jgi:transposase
MLDSRESAEVAKWLQTYPHICVVSRDGSTTYANAISTAHPDAIQVSDRFHLLKGLTDAAGQYIRGMIVPRIRIESDTRTEVSDSMEKNGRCEVDLPERLPNGMTERKALAVQRVRELAAKGLTVGTIVKETGHSYETVKKYIGGNFDVAHKEYGANCPNNLKPYTNIIDEMLTHRKRFREIEGAIRSFGYVGATSTIRGYVTGKRRDNKAVYKKAIANTKVIERKWLLKLLYNPIEKVKEITRDQLEKVMRDYPDLSTVYQIVRDFREIMFSKRVDDLDTWIEHAKAFDAQEINSFLNGILRDIKAVKNGIRYDYNNGLAEGSVNKIKLYKRIMFGRCSFELLRTKTLLREQSRGTN